MCPHFAILGATGVLKQIGQELLCDSDETRICKTLFQSNGTSGSMLCGRYDTAALVAVGGGFGWTMKR